MLTTDEIKLYLDEDAASQQKEQARIGQKYYDGQHDILDYRMFYWNADDELVEDKARSNAKIPHPFFTELVDQAVQFIMSDKEGFVMSDDPKLQAELDVYFNKNKRFKVELSETITGIQIKGYDYMYAVKKNDRLCFENADSLGVVEVEGRFADDGKDQIIWKYVDRIDKEGKTQFKVLVIDDENTYYFTQTDNGEIMPDDDAELNPRPHALYEKDGKLYRKPFGFLPVFRMDNNKKKTSLLRAVKALIDDYDIMASSLTNNLIDFDTPLHVVKGFDGTTREDMEKLQQNLKTKKMVGVDENGGVEVHTVNIPYEAREAKMGIDEKAIYKFGMGLNMAGLKDTAATTNIAIKAAYSLLELRCSKIIDQLELFLMDLVEVVLNEINDKNGTGYTKEQVYIDIQPEIMANEQENAQIELTQAQKQQTVINTLLSLASHLDNETIIQNICDVLDIDYMEIKDKLPDPDEGLNNIIDAGGELGNIEPVDGGGVGE